MPEFDFGSLIEQKENDNGPVTKKLPEVKVKKSKKKQVKKPKKSSINEGIEITSDELRTAFYLIKKSSSRGSIDTIFKNMREFFNTHKVQEIGYRTYEIIEK